jgi:hypothetical protein
MSRKAPAEKRRQDEQGEETSNCNAGFQNLTTAGKAGPWGGSADKRFKIAAAASGNVAVPAQRMSSEPCAVGYGDQ